MKKFLISLLLITIISSILIVIASCGSLDTSDESENQTESIFPNSTDEQNSSLQNNQYIISTFSETDDYELAGTYTILNQEMYSTGDKIKLKATVNDGYNFEGWYINSMLLSDNLNYTYTVTNKNIIIEAVYSKYTVSTTSTGNTGGVAGTYTTMHNKKTSEGEKIKLVATVNDGYNFEGWYVGKVCVSKKLTYVYTMEKENITFEAKYSSYSLSTMGVAKDSNGKAEPGFNAGTYTQHSNTKLSNGKSITLTATVNDGYNFVGWFINDNCVSTNKQYTFTMSKEDVMIQAVYSYYTLTSTARYHLYYNSDKWYFDNPSFYISPKYDEEKISIGKPVTLIAKEFEGFVFESWCSSDGAILSNNKEYSFYMEESDIEIYALYEKQYI